MIDNKTLLFIKQHQNEHIHTLAFQAKRYPDIDIPFIIQQITGRQIAKEKIPAWYRKEEIIYPKHISLEQSSSERTAKYKASLCIKGNTFIDLTGGLGIDFSFISPLYKTAIYVEKQTELTEIFRHNAQILGLGNIHIINDNAENYLNQCEHADTIYIDPSRRDSTGSKTVFIEDCSPNLINIEPIIEKKCRQAIFKLSPMLDITKALTSLNMINEVHIVSYNNECKELLFVKNKNIKQSNIVYHCVNLLQEDGVEKYIFSKEEEENVVLTYSNDIGKFLYEPNASVMKGGAYKSVAKDFKVDKLNPNSHLYTSQILIDKFPGRKFSVINIIPFDKKHIKNELKEIKQANITVRNFPLSVEEIRKRTSIKDGGEIYIFATTLANDKKVLVIGKKIKKR